MANSAKYPNWQGKLILIVEDVEHNYMFFSALLKLTHAEVKITTDGLQAVEFCKNNPNIDIVLMDLKLPKMTGLEAIKEIRKLRPDLPIIAQTAYAWVGQKEKVLNLGANEFLSKPVQKDDLLEVISKYVK